MMRTNKKTTKFTKTLKNNYSNYFFLFLTFLFLLILVFNNIGLTFRERIPLGLGDSLDFSWFSDAIERLNHGYILGRDFTFTYGPLFQFIYALPTLIFNVPSYISVKLAPIISYVLQFFIIYYIAKNLTKNIFEQISYILFVFIVLGALISSSTDTVRILIPLAYALFIYNTLQKSGNFLSRLLLILFPTLAGLYSYNLFITCSLLVVLLSAFHYLRRGKEQYSPFNYFLIILFILFAQVIISLLLTQNFDYIKYSFDAVSNYRSVLSLTWTSDRNNVLLVFPAALILFAIIYRKSKLFSLSERKSIGILIFAALLHLMYAISRSDAGHLLYALYPSVIVFFTFIFMGGYKSRVLLIIGILLYTIVPFKPTLYNTLAPKNIAKVFQVIHEKPSFFDFFVVTPEYYFTKQEIHNIQKIIDENRGNVYIYPYDSFILNSKGTTYNTYALGTYTYSNSIVEEKTVENFNAHPPRVIILAIDTKGALNLDDIPSFTRNPLIAKWMIRNYRVNQITKKYLVLEYSPAKKTNNNACLGHELSFEISKKDTLTQKITSLLKPPIYYIDEIRIPYDATRESYFIFTGTTDAEGLAKLFAIGEQHACPNPYMDSLLITRVSPFLKHKKSIIFTKNEFLSKQIILR